MLLTTNYSSVCFTQVFNQPHNVLVQAKSKEDISRLFPKFTKRIEKGYDSACPWQLTLSKKELSKVISDYILQNLKYTKEEWAPLREIE